MRGEEPIQNVDNSLPDGWERKRVEDCLSTDGVERRPSIPRSAYRTKGRFPVVDQGQALIAGFTDDETSVHRMDLPLIVFGDHTRAVKFVDFPFATGADGTKLLRAKSNQIDPRFFYYGLLNIELPSRGYNRHFGLLREKSIDLPCDPEEQHGIADVLSKLHARVEIQDRIVGRLKELRAATMAKVFREGLRGEALKQTDVGEIPESWDVVPLGKVLKEAQYGLSVRGGKTGRYPILRMNCQEGGKVVFRDLQFVDLETSTFEKYRLNPGDILFNRTNSHELVGRSAILEDPRPAVFASYLLRLATDRDKLLPAFLNDYFSLSPVQGVLRSLATRAVGQSNISASKLRLLRVPLPPLDEQSAFVSISESLASALRLARAELECLTVAFDHFLEALVTGQLRVPPKLAS